jgi:hypothetical protein
VNVIWGGGGTWYVFCAGVKKKISKNKRGKMKIENRSNAVNYRPGLCMKVAELPKGIGEEQAQNKKRRKIWKRPIPLFLLRS